MNFFSSNENFIKIKFHSEMKAMSFEEKILHYNKHLKAETLKRTIAYFEKLQAELFMITSLNGGLGLITSADFGLETKTKAYGEIIRLLKDYEYELIICSIYFENVENQIISDLFYQLVEVSTKDWEDKYLINSFITKHDSYKGLIYKSILTDKLGLTDKDWEEEDIKGNPIVVKLMYWLENKLIIRNTESEIKLVLFHYSKLWNLNYSNPYNERKGIVLLNSLTLSLNKVLTNLKVDFNNILFELKSIFDSLLCKVCLPPFLEGDNALENKARPAILSGYNLKKIEFNSLKKESSKYLIDFEKLSTQHLMSAYFNSNESLQKLIYEKITKSINAGYYITKSDIEFFDKLENEESFSTKNDSQKLREYFYKTNYLFSKVIFN